jgi:predicted transcriptional regulator
MKTTVDLPEELLSSVRDLAEQREWEIKEVFEESLRAFLDLQSKPASAKPFRLKHTIVRGRAVPEISFAEMLEVWDANRLRR